MLGLKHARRRIAGAIEALGEEVTLEVLGKSYNYRAVVSPILERNRQYLEHSQNSFGGFDMSYYLYYGPPTGGGEFIRSGAKVKCLGESFGVRRKETVVADGAAVYIWAVLIREEAGE